MTHCSLKEIKGLTLVELISTVAVLSILVFIITGSLSMSKAMATKNRIDSQIQGDISRAMQMISKDLREALQGVEQVTTGESGIIPPCTDPSKNVCIVTDHGITFKTPERTDETGLYYKTVSYAHSSENQTLSRVETDSGGVETSNQIIGRRIKRVLFTKDAEFEDSIRMVLEGENNLLMSSQVFLRSSE